VAGRYRIVAKKAGFSDFTLAEVRLDARQALRVKATLSVAAMSETIEVSSGPATALNTESGTIGDTKSFEQVTALPVNYRGATASPLAALATMPSVQQDSSGSVSVGGDVTVTTKGGGNDFHGSAFEYHQDDALDARVYGFDTKAPKNFNTFGGSLSGPIRKDRTFFFGDYEGNRRRTSTPCSSSSSLPPSGRETSRASRPSQVAFPIRGADALFQLGIVGLDLSDHPDNHAFPFFNFGRTVAFFMAERRFLTGS